MSECAESRRRRHLTSDIRYLISNVSLDAKSRHRIDAGGAPRGDDTCEQRHRAEQQHNTDIRGRIERRNAEQHRADRATRGERAYADLGYWNDLQCARPNRKCQRATDRLKQALNHPIGGGRVAADRVMFGTDWLMLSREKDWSAYPRRLLNTISGIAPGEVEKIFARNAKNCFTRLR